MHCQTVSETFVHRSGHTGRAGKKGTAILIYTEDQTRQVKIYEREIGCRFTQVIISVLYAFACSRFVLYCSSSDFMYIFIA